MNNYTYGFFDNQTIGVDELNKITADVVSGGVSAVYSGNSFKASEINSTNMAIFTGGVVPYTDTALKVVKSGSKYLINPGIAFFDDGTKMEILTGGEEITPNESGKSYVYLVSDSDLMKCYVDIAAAEKTEGNFVLLAVISEKGVITDKRKYSAGKKQGFYAGTLGMPVSVSYTITPDFYSKNEPVKIFVGKNGIYKNALIYVISTISQSMSYLTFDDLGVLTLSKSIGIFNGGVYSDNNYVYGAFSGSIYKPNYRFDRSTIKIADGYFSAELSVYNEYKNPDENSVVNIKLW